MNRLRTVALVKQVPLGDPPLGPDARLLRDGRASEMNAWCRRAVAQAVRLGDSTAITMGPPSAVDVLLEAAAWGAGRSVHVCDPALAGADCLVTARALAATVRALGPADLILVGHSSTDGSTGAVGPMLAELLGLPFIGPAMEITVDNGILHTTLQVEGGVETVAVRLPAVVAVAERSCPPCKAAPDTWPDASIVERWTTAELDHRVGSSPTAVIGIRHTPRDRRRLRFSSDSTADAVRALDAMALAEGPPEAEPVPPTSAERRARTDRTILAVGNGSDEAGRRALLGELATLASGPVVSVGERDAGPWGADEQIVLRGTEPRQAATALSDWVERTGMPWAIVGGSTWWDREVLARLAVRLDAGLMSDLTGVALRDGRLVGAKPTGQGMLAEIVGTGPTQIATIRTGTLPLRAPRQATSVHPTTLEVATEPAITRLHHQADDDYSALDRADTVIGIGRGVRPEDYGELEPLREVLSAELAATRKVTDAGLMPHSRQLGVTARSIAPKLYVAIGVQGNANHSVGVSRAHTVLAINNDPNAPIFDHSDIGIVGDWREVVPLLVAELHLTRAVRA